MVDPAGDAIFPVRRIYNSVLKLKSWIIVSNRSSNSLKNLRALCLGQNGECWGVVRADLEMEDVLSCRLV
jgi:hypothetical protein